MIDLHTHTLFSDGELLPSELVRRAEIKGYKVIALTDHADSSNIDFIIPRIVKVCKVLNKSWEIFAIPGVEITHAPLKEIKPLVKFARKNGAKIVIVHGETVSEPVIPGTNRCAIEARCDILAHPGFIKKADVVLAKKLGVSLELTARKSHSKPNKHVLKLAMEIGAKMVLDTDSHSPENLISDVQADAILKGLGLHNSDINNIYNNSLRLAKRAGYPG
ncbi:MAG: histidinol phosphate phosphatase domain-containing protein [Candidatus Omnitrophota bacterium]|jgi:histidinol phosphatase-like PHP family hydrolase